MLNDQGSCPELGWPVLESLFWIPDSHVLPVKLIARPKWCSVEKSNCWQTLKLCCLKTVRTQFQWAANFYESRLGCGRTYKTGGAMRCALRYCAGKAARCTRQRENRKCAARFHNWYSHMKLTQEHGFIPHSCSRNIQSTSWQRILVECNLSCQVPQLQMSAELALYVWSIFQDTWQWT